MKNRRIRRSIKRKTIKNKKIGGADIESDKDFDGILEANAIQAVVDASGGLVTYEQEEKRLERERERE